MTAPNFTEELRRRRAERRAQGRAAPPREEPGEASSRGLESPGFTHTSRCLACSAELVWVTLASGKRHPLNAEPLKVSRIEGGRRVKVCLEGAHEFVTMFRSDDGPHLGRESHFATCPKAGVTLASGKRHPLNAER